MMTITFPNHSMLVAAGSLAFGQALWAGEQAVRNAIEFLDPRTIEHTYFLDRRITPAEKHPGNPVIADCHSAQTVLQDRDGSLRLWYVTRRKIPGYTGSAREYTLRYAESTDGVTWTRPELGLKEFDGTWKNNVLITAHDTDSTGRKLTGQGGLVCGNFSIIDRERGPAPHTRGRFTALINQGNALGLVYSDDGLRWTAYPENPVFDASWSDTNNNLVFDPDIGRYVLYYRPHPRVHAGPRHVNRLVARIESADLINWDLGSARCVLDTDARDAPAFSAVKDARGRDRQFYGMLVSRHQDFYLGLPNLLDEGTGHMDLRLVNSPDGVDWQREPNETPFVTTTPGAWDCGTIGFVATGCPIQVGDDLLFYYGGTNMTHNYKIMNDEKTLKMRLGLATVRRGRLVGYHAGEAEGELLTRPFLLDKPCLRLNADAADGEVRAALLRADGTPIPGRGKGTCEPLHNDGLDLPLRWRDHGSLNDTVGTRVRLRLYVRNAAVYAIQTAPSED
ncbi:MAG: hypothetical protein HN742_43335 [Lentisphaerae bacterium]|jgi:hypothetical protein|nr:hypothetical protein [Lentisphaerota bacterium]MBT4814901.1 hypothetical protein [Lentisphaerota bacterium]MBT5609095.1 hypothetical protein [Lentisphaerota bacterium]MBT7057258.1 hypothetical protein [Lentisphaerota bacterium]MBT7848773.1 hypothetical protein [Lentisphaerota bacterium]